mmetsp:Transcript_93584/g.214013  ORF Transcript_93584/g.214013 Transcript_93584/m.214013 type:complete len:471 (+) Transcript_93584:43-1455(+)
MKALLGWPAVLALDVQCWQGGYIEEICCAQPPTVDCWSPPFTFEWCCTVSVDEETGGYGLRAEVADWLEMWERRRALLWQRGWSIGTDLWYDAVVDLVDDPFSVVGMHPVYGDWMHEDNVNYLRDLLHFGGYARESPLFALALALSYSGGSLAAKFSWCQHNEEAEPMGMHDKTSCAGSPCTLSLAFIAPQFAEVILSTDWGKLLHPSAYEIRLSWIAGSGGGGILLSTIARRLAGLARGQRRKRKSLESACDIQWADIQAAWDSGTFFIVDPLQSFQSCLSNANQPLVEAADDHPCRPSEAAVLVAQTLFELVTDPCARDVRSRAKLGLRQAQARVRSCTVESFPHFMREVIQFAMWEQLAALAELARHLQVPESGQEPQLCSASDGSDAVKVSMSSSPRSAAVEGVNWTLTVVAGDVHGPRTCWDRHVLMLPAREGCGYLCSRARRPGSRVSECHRGPRLPEFGNACC